MSTDEIRAFILRNDARIRLLGREYAYGTFSIDQVASLRGIHPVDAVAVLEQGGFARGLDAIRLDAADRAANLEKLRADRLARASQPPAFSQEQAARSAIASKRLENVDARRWILGITPAVPLRGE
jgi:hypothetical protein